MSLPMRRLHTTRLWLTRRAVQAMKHTPSSLPVAPLDRVGQKKPCRCSKCTRDLVQSKTCHKLAPDPGNKSILGWRDTAAARFTMTAKESDTVLLTSFSKLPQHPTHPGQPDRCAGGKDNICQLSSVANSLNFMSGSGRAGENKKTPHEHASGLKYVPRSMFSWKHRSSEHVGSSTHML